ncbi:hypothetical protein DICSQDRAFT_141698, partial [Dichomitus squalens LYAD-421 SS1]
MRLACRNGCARPGGGLSTRRRTQLALVQRIESIASGIDFGGWTFVDMSSAFLTSLSV